MSKSSVVSEESSLMPKPIRHLWNGTSHLCEAFEIGCRGIRDTTQGIDEITSIMLRQQRERLLSEVTRPSAKQEVLVN